MKPIQILLNEISKRIEVTSTLITEFEKGKNATLAVENILFKYGITKDDLDIDSLIKIENEDFNQILEEMQAGNILELTQQFLENKEIIKLYYSLQEKHGQVPDATQYYEAKEILNKIVLLIKNHLKKYENEQKEHILSLEEVLATYKQTFNKFKGGQLAEPILDLEMMTFHDLLNKCGFDLTNKAAIKKAVGQANYNLTEKPNLARSEDARLLDKYRVILEKKKERYSSYITAVKSKYLANRNLTIKNYSELMNRISSENPDMEIDIIENVIVSILLENQISKYDDSLARNIEITENQKEEIIVICEEILLIYRPKEVESSELQPNKLGETSFDIKSGGVQLLDSAKEIIALEYESLKNYAEDDATRYSMLLTLGEKYALEESSLEKDKHSLALIIETLRLSTNLFENILNSESFEEYETEYKAKINEITELIETYQIVKKRIKEEVPENKKVEKNLKKVS